MEVDLAVSDPGWTCRELSTQSEALWRSALSHGCLSKALNDKDVLYSHHKAVSEWQLGRSNLFPDPETTSASEFGVGEAHLGEEGGDENVRNLAEAERKFQPLLLSPVILEDLTLPPRAVDDTAPALFSLHELLKYLKSSDWAYTVRLRVVGGDLLRTLNNSLISLEKRRLVNVHSAHANANNRVKRKPPEEQNKIQKAEANVQQTVEQELVVQEADVGKGRGKAKGRKQKAAQFLEADANTKRPSPVERRDSQMSNRSESDSHMTEPLPAVEKKKLELPKAYLTDPKWEYEKLSLEVVYYEKCAKSNIPYIIPDFEKLDVFEDFPLPKTLPRPLTREPYSHKSYRTEKIRLPASENVDMRKYISRLELELEELKRKQSEQAEEAKLKAAMEKGKGAAKDGKTRDTGRREEAELSLEDHASVKSLLMRIPDVEYIADDPHIQLAEPKEKSGGLSRKASGKKVAEWRKGSLSPENGEKEDVTRKLSTSVVGLTSVTDKFSALRSPIRSLETPEESSSDHTLMNVSGDESGSFSSLNATWKSLEPPEEVEPGRHLLEQLSLTREELYVSGLYTAREENRRTAEEKLDERRRMRAKERALVAQQVMESALKRAKGDLYSSFKHLARRKEAERIRKTRPMGTQIPRSTRCANSRSQSEKSCKGIYKNPVKTISGYPQQSTSRYKQKSILKPLSPKDVKMPQEQFKETSAKSSLPAITDQPTSQEPTKLQESNGLVETSFRGLLPLRTQEKAGKWEFYRREQDRCEMEAALNNTLEQGLLERMPTRNFHPNYTGVEDLASSKEKSVKSKGEKNKSQNKKYDKNENWLNQNIANQRCTILSKKYPTSNMVLSAHEHNLKNRRSGVKSNMIHSSVCIGNPPNLHKGSRKPPVRRIGFTSPSDLMKYLLSVREALHTNITPFAWRFFGCVDNRLSVRQEQKNSNVLLTPQASRKSNVPQPDANNSAIFKEPKVHSALGSRNLRDTLANHNTHDSDGIQPVPVLRKTLLDVNKSAASDITSVPSKLQSESVRTIDTDMKLQVVAEPEAEAEVEAEGEGEDNETERQSSELALTVSEILERDLRCFGEACTCEECEGQADILADLRPTGQVFTEVYGCPPTLGRLRRDFSFLRTASTSNVSQDPNKRLRPSGRVPLPERPPVLDVFQVGDQLQEMMDDVMIRKEVLCSSRGFTYVTITFTQCRARENTTQGGD